jgi:hypothetical protein
MRGVFGALLVMLVAAPSLTAQLPSCSVGSATKQCQIPPISGTLIPNDLVGGDAEFAGHPVRVSIKASRRLSADSTALYVDLEMVAIEVVKDSTWIAGVDSILLFRAAKGWKISPLPELALGAKDQVDFVLYGKDAVVLTPKAVAQDRSTNDGLCRRHPSDVCQTMTNNGVVARWTVWGDSNQRDLGQTHMVVDFASLSLNVIRPRRQVAQES